MVKIGLIGGSGLEKLNIFQHAEEIQTDTPFGQPSSPLLHGSVGNCEVYIISRHGPNHSITPSHVNNRANIWALKEAGCKNILATTACGSLREEIKRGDLVILDQFIDFTHSRINTFFDHFEQGNVVHTAMADPFSTELRQLLIETSQRMGLPFHPAGTVVTIEGPRFSTRAESMLFRSFGADVINMSIAPEVALANEVGIPYAAIALSTDYDSWKRDEDPVTWNVIVQVFEENVKHVTSLLVNALKVIKS